MAYQYPVPNPPVPEKDDVVTKSPNRSSRLVIEKIAADGYETYLDRFALQQPQCLFGLRGTCCRMCQWGPCHISKKATRGVCGRNQEEIVISNLLRGLVAGLSAHARHAHEILFTVKGISEGRINLPLLGTERIGYLAGELGLNQSRSERLLAREIADLLIQDLSRMENKSLSLLSVFAPRERISVWAGHGILPRSAAYEVMEGLHMTTLGSCSDWEAIARQEQRAALAYCYSSLFASSFATEILFGLPKPKETHVNYRVIEPDMVNILVHGHSPVVAEKLLEKVRLAEVRQMAIESGATGINVAGLCCTGAEMLARHGVPAVTNILGQELILGTGAVDCIVADMQCVIPGLKTLADCYGTRVITTCNSNRIPGALHVPFDPEQADTLDLDALAIVQEAVTAFRTRDRSKVSIPETTIKATTGWCYENILETLGGVENILCLLKDGRLRGIATIVGCNTPKVIYENNHVAIATRLVEDDILILTTGCSSYALLNAGLCHQEARDRCGEGLKSVIDEYAIPPVLAVGGCVDNTRTLRLFIAISNKSGIAIKDLPFMFVGPEPGNEKTIGQGLSFLLHGVSNLVGFPAPIPLPYLKPKRDGEPDELERVSNPVADYFGGDGALNDFGAKVYTETEPELAAQTIKMHLERKRRALGW